MVAARLLSGGYSVGTPGDSFLWITPRLGADGTKPLVVMLHGATGNPSVFLDSQNWANQFNKLVKPIIEADYPLIAPMMGGDKWGNDVALGLITDAVTYGQTHGAKPGKVIIVGGSMGGGASYAWCRANLAQVEAMVGVIPVSDLNDFVVNNRDNLAASVNAAYGGAYSDATYGAIHNPKIFVSQLAGLRLQVWYATDDPVVIPATVTAVTDAIPGADVHAVTGGHSDVTFGKIDSTVLLNFLAGA